MIDNSNNENNTTSITNDNVLAQSIDNAVKVYLKERKRDRIKRFILRFIMFIIAIIILIALLDNPVTSPVANNNTEKHIGIITINGEIAPNTTASAELINESLQKAFENQNSVAVILKVNSPGGSPVQAGMVYDEIKRLRKIYTKKPVYVAIEDICASGCYYIASAGDYIYSDKASIVGSIGVIMEGFGFNEAMNKFGVQRRVYTSGANKAILDPFSPENPEHVSHVKHMINTILAQFVKSVKDGRGSRLKEDANTFSGLIWTGEEAQKIGLVDGLSSMTNIARNIVKNENLVDYTTQEGLANRLAKQFGASVGTAISNKIDLQIK